jgi:hypothetical protein
VRLAPLAVVLAAASTLAATGGCANLKYGSAAVVTPTPAVTSTPTSGPCNATPTVGAQLIAISPLITPTSDPTYGVVAGYGLSTNGNVSNVAAPIVVSPSATIQFFDNDVSNSQLHYSAAGIPNVSAFPSPSFTFPPAATAATGTVINATTTWSTGLLSGQCYSQAFTIKAPGVYYFGDVNYYALGNLRDVIVATSSP